MISIPKRVKDPEKINRVQETAARDAILWLLSKTPHSVEELSENFEMSQELVSYFMEKLSREKLVVKDKNLGRFEIKEPACP